MSQSNNVVDFFKYYKKPEKTETIYTWDEYGFTTHDHKNTEVDISGFKDANNDMWATLHASEAAATIQVLIELGLISRDAKYERSTDLYHITINPPEANNS